MTWREALIVFFSSTFLEANVRFCVAIYTTFQRREKISSQSLELSGISKKAASDFRPANNDKD